jgi:hypothetical protein
MNARISARELFEQLGERLSLRWVAGERGAERVLEAVETVARRPSLAGYLNAIYPNKVQILGTEELGWMDTLDARQRWDTIHKIVHQRPLALVVSKDQPCPEDLRIAAEETDTPLWTSPRRGHELLNHLLYHLARKLAPRVTLHGVFMEIYSIGVLITGESGSGKSELALDLVTRGARVRARWYCRWLSSSCPRLGEVHNGVPNSSAAMRRSSGQGWSLLMTSANGPKPTILAIVSQRRRESRLSSQSSSSVPRICTLLG